MRKYVIIGSGVAGVSAAEAIRGLDPDGKITLYNGEPFPYYFRAAMAFYIKGVISEDELSGRPPEWAREHRIRVLNEKVTEVRVADREVTGASGMVEPYDRLLIATGSWPLVAPWPGAGAEGVVTYRSLMCARKTIDHIRKRPVKKAVVIGGGILGVEFVEDFHNLGIETTLVVREERILELLFDAEGSAVIQRQMEDDGVRVLLGEELAEVKSGAGGHVEAIVTASGETIETQLVGVAIGVKPYIEFLENSGLEINRGVIVDEKLRANQEGVYAAGDVAVRRVGGSYVPCRTWLTAAEQGRRAGRNMAGEDRPFAEEVFFNASHAYKSIYAVVGQFNAPEKAGVRRVRLAAPEGEYARLVVDNGRIIGGMFIGHVDAVWETVAAIRTGRQVDADRLPSLDSAALKQALTGKPPLLF